MGRKPLRPTSRCLCTTTDSGTSPLPSLTIQASPTNFYIGSVLKFLEFGAPFPVTANMASRQMAVPGSTGAMLVIARGAR